MGKRTYSFISVALFLILFYVSTPSVQAEGDKKVYDVVTDNLNVRGAPDYDAEVTGYLHSGDQITAFQEKHGWVQTYYSGKQAWVASQYLHEVDQTETAEHSNSTSETITVTKGSVHLRTGPGVDYAIAKLASEGDTFSLIEKSENWLQIDIGDGTRAWVASWLTDQTSAGHETQATTDSENTAQSTADNGSSASSDVSGDSLDGYNIMLDPGHGGIDPGAIGINGEQEKDLALDITNAVAEKLRDEGATVLLTRSSNSYVSLEERMQQNDAYMIDAFISLHLDSSPSSNDSGVSTHYYENGNDSRLAQSIQDALSENTGMRNRGIKQDNFHVLRENSTDSVLVELGFITNPYDLAFIHDSQNASVVAEAISIGLKDYFH